MLMRSGLDSFEPPINPYVPKFLCAIIFLKKLFQSVVFRKKYCIINDVSICKATESEKSNENCI